VANGILTGSHPEVISALVACVLSMGQAVSASAKPDGPSGPVAGQDVTSATESRPDERIPALGSGARREWAVFLYGGKWSDNRFVEILQLQTEFGRSHLGAVGASTTLYRFNPHLSLEGEMNLVRHWGRQDHFEVNASVNLRWSTFPWDHHVDTSVAYGLGPSYAFERPPIEVRPDRPAAHRLAFMMGELAFAPPGQRGASWEGLIRIHHRSGVFDLVSKASGSNFVTAGLRYRF
jgi:hypothetical protein